MWFLVWISKPRLPGHLLSVLVLIFFRPGYCSVSSPEFTAAQVGQDVTATWTYSPPEWNSTLLLITVLKGSDQVFQYIPSTVPPNLLPGPGYGGRVEAVVTDSQVDCTLKDFTAADEGSYRAEFTYPGEGWSINERSFTFIAMPVHCSVTSPEFTAAEVGHDVTATWTYSPPEGNPTLLVITVLKRSQLVFQCIPSTVPPNLFLEQDYGGRVEAVVTDSQVDFTLKNFTKDDEGSYRAEITYRGVNEAINEKSFTFIAVPVPPNPILTISGYTAGVSAGQSLPLTCTSTQGKPPAQVTWWKEDVEQQQAVYSSTPDASTYQGDAASTLTLAVQPANNMETYQCRVSHLGTELERQDLQLNVRFMTGPPTLTGYSGPINSGSSLTLTCTSGSSNPPVTISWTLVGGSASSATDPPDTEGQYGGTITAQQTILPNQRPQDNGSQVKCTATNSELGQSLDSSTVTISVRFYLGGIGIAGHTNPVTSGGSLTLTCTSGSSNPPATISWTRVGGAVPTGTDQPQTDGQHGGKITSQQISLTNLQAQDNGAQFKCTVTNSAVSQSEEKTVTIDVQYAPTNVQVSCNPSDLSDLREGGRLECTCTADSNPAAQYSWTKGSTAGPLPTDAVVDNTAGTLTFSTLDRAHSGEYSCTANNGISPQATRGGVSLDIKYAPEEPTIASNTTTVEEGDSVQLTCRTTSNPPASFNWTKQYGDLPDDARETAVGQTSSLVIPGLTKNDHGTYICTASNFVLPGGTAEDYNLTVLYLHLPMLSSNDVSSNQQQATVRENTNVSITCTADANPTADIKWTSPLGEVTNGGKLQFNPVERRHAGNYTCEASNSIKGEPRSKYVTVEITVNYPASITFITPPATVNEYDDVSLTCTADSNPEPGPDNFSWAYMNGTTLPGTTSSDGFSLTTTITAITYQQAGTYTCAAGNGIGTAASAGTNITVEYAPKFYPHPDPYPAAIGTDVSMHCSAFAVPRNITFSWFKNGTTLTNSIRLTIQSSGETSVLTIRGVVEGDYGTYNCTVANGKGSSSTTRTLQPLGLPGNPSGLIVLSKNTQFVVRIAWTAGFNGGLETTHTVQLREVGANQWEDVGSREQTASEQQRTFNIALDLKAHQAGDYQIRIKARNTQGGAWSESVDLKLEASQRLSGRMTTNENWVEALKDSESTEFRLKKALWERNLDKIFSSLIGYEGATITQFSQGSVVGDFEAVVAESETKAAIEAFETQVNTGSVGDLAVVKESSQISVTRPPDGDSTTTIIIIAAVVCGVVFLAIIGVGVFVFRRRKSANETNGQNHQNNIELDRVRDDTDGGYQSLKIPNRRTSDHTYQGLMARSGNETSPDATYEDVKTQSEFPRNQLDIKEELGQGEFGSVYKAEAWEISGNTGVTTVAVKELKGMTSPASSTAFFKELSVLKLLGTHPNVVSFLGCCTDAEPFYLLLEYVSGGSLQSNLRTSHTQQTYGNLHGGSKSLSSRDLTKFAWDVAKGMSFLSAKKILHRDLATRNVLVSADRTCKVSDFGFSREGDEYERTTKTRLPIRWMAPESLFHRKYTTKTDVWAFGVLLWEIVTLGATPYPGMSKREVMDGVQQGYRMDKPPHCDEKLYTLMMNCWEADPSRRPEFRKIQRTLDSLMETEHDYIHLASLDENTYTSLQTASDEKY